MNTRRMLLLALTLTLAFHALGAPDRIFAAEGVASPKAGSSQAAKHLSILFIGNSYTYVNDLPSMVKRLFSERGIQIECEKVTTGGATLERHVKEGKAAAAIHKRKWDYVVLQEQSTRPFVNREAMFRDARLLHEEIRKSGAKTVLYETWASKKTPTEQARLTDAYETLGRELGAIVVPAGEAWKRALAQGMELHGKDGRHPNPHGTYLSACAFVRALGGARALKSAPSRGAGQPAPIVPAAQASALWRIADEVVRNQAAALKK